MEAGKKAAGEVLALQKRVLAVLNEARFDLFEDPDLVMQRTSFSEIRSQGNLFSSIIKT